MYKFKQFRRTTARRFTVK